MPRISGSETPLNLLCLGWEITLLSSPPCPMTWSLGPRLGPKDSMASCFLSPAFRGDHVGS